MPSINKIRQSFELLYQQMLDRNFSKSTGLIDWGEKGLLPAVRLFLLGYFGREVAPEVWSKLPTSSTGEGRIDFFVGSTAIEFAVRTTSCPHRKIRAKENATEIIKLMKYEGPGVLVLFDFHKSPYDLSELENEYRTAPHNRLIHGRHNKYPFSVIYFYREDGVPRSKRLNIRTASKH